MNMQPNEHNIPSDLEARIVALVLGEASDFEKAELEAMLAEREDLRAFRDEIARASGLLEAELHIMVSAERLADEDLHPHDPSTANDNADESSNWQLSSDRRKEVLSVISQSTKENGAETSGDPASVPSSTTTAANMRPRPSAKSRPWWLRSKVIGPIGVACSFLLVACMLNGGAREATMARLEFNQADVDSLESTESFAGEVFEDFDGRLSEGAHVNGGTTMTYEKWSAVAIAAPEVEISLNREFATSAKDSLARLSDSMNIDLDASAPSKANTFRSSVAASDGTVSLPTPDYLYDMNSGPEQAPSPTAAPPTVTRSSGKGMAAGRGVQFSDEQGPTSGLGVPDLPQLSLPEQPDQSIAMAEVSVPDGGSILLGGIRRYRQEPATSLPGDTPSGPADRWDDTPMRTESLAMGVTPRIIIANEEEGLVDPGSAGNQPAAANSNSFFVTPPASPMLDGVGVVSDSAGARYGIARGGAPSGTPPEVSFGTSGTPDANGYFGRSQDSSGNGAPSFAGDSSDQGNIENGSGKRLYAGGMGGYGGGMGGGGGGMGGGGLSREAAPVQQPQTSRFVRPNVVGDFAVEPSAKPSPQSAEPEFPANLSLAMSAPQQQDVEFDSKKLGQENVWQATPDDYGSIRLKQELSKSGQQGLEQGQQELAEVEAATGVWGAQGQTPPKPSFGFGVDADADGAVDSSEGEALFGDLYGEREAGFVDAMRTVEEAAIPMESPALAYPNDWTDLSQRHAGQSASSTVGKATPQSVEGFSRRGNKTRGLQELQKNIEAKSDAEADQQISELAAKLGSTSGEEAIELYSAVPERRSGVAVDFADKQSFATSEKQIPPVARKSSREDSREGIDFERLKDSESSSQVGAGLAVRDNTGGRDYSSARFEKREATESARARIKALKRTQPPSGLDEKDAAKEAFSTFSLHVSDVSFKLAQAALGQGKWPEAAKIRIEEFVNAFDYGDPLPNRTEKVAANVEQCVHPFIQQRNLMRVAMRTSATGRASKTPLRLTLLIDNSGSMERADRRETVTRAFNLLATQLLPSDRVTLISFARTPRLIADGVGGRKVSELAKQIALMPSEGGTNIEAALKLAFEKAQEHKVDGAQNRIILFTDGAVNLGDAKPESLSRMIEQIREAGVAFDAAGISADGLNDEVLEALTRKGDGRYYLLGSAESADAGFARQVAGALRPSAKNVKVQVEFNPQRVGRYKLLGFEKHTLKKEDFRNDSVDAAEMAAEEAGVAVYQFEVKPDGQGDVGFVSVRFQDIATGQMVENRWPIPYESSAPRIDQAAPGMQIAATAALFAAKLRGEPLGDAVDISALNRLASEFASQPGVDPRVGVLVDMIRQARQLSE